MIVINLPFYIPTRKTTKTLTFARDSVKDATNLYIHYKGSTVYPLFWYESTDGGTTWTQQTQTINSPGDLATAKGFPLDVERNNPREPFNPNTTQDAWKLTVKNYVICDKYGSQVVNGINCWIYDDGTTQYAYSIHDGAWLSIQSNIITVDGKYVGASRMSSVVIDLSQYEQYDDAGNPIKNAEIFTPLKIPALNLDASTGKLTLQDPTTYKAVVLQSVEADGVVRIENDREHWCTIGGLPCGDTGLWASHFMSRDFNVLFKLNWTYLDQGNGDWDLASIRLTVLDEFDVSWVSAGQVISTSAVDATQVVNFLSESNRFPEEYIPPVVYCVHRDENGNTIGVTRLGFLNETTEILVKKHIDANGNPVYDDVYIVAGSSRKKVDVGLADIRYFKKIA